jgi:hypothetical protein
LYFTAPGFVLSYTMPSPHSGEGSGWVRMRLIDYLGAFAVEDLRELARRRGIPLHQEALRGRQTLLRVLAASLGSYEAVRAAVYGLNQAELSLLKLLLENRSSPSLSGLARVVGSEPASLKGALDGLRLWGLVFPEGDWEHIGVPGSTRLVESYLAPSKTTPEGQLNVDFVPPTLHPAEAPTEPRPASFGWDAAELLARIARTRCKLTQAGKMNRRDLRTMETAFSVKTYGYAYFLHGVVAGLGLVSPSQGYLGVPDQADAWLAQEELRRAALTLSRWESLQGYPESANTDPADSDYIPLMLQGHRGRVAAALRESDAADGVSVESLARRLVWLAPLSFRQWDGSQDAALITSRMLRSLYWLGLLAVDDAEAPKHARVTPLGARVLGLGGTPAPLVPEEAQFFLQPNAEAFAPPNLSPRTVFHLRRITGEKKGGPAGMYPITAESLRRAFDTGLKPSAVAQFLERFSRTGLPSNVRALVETTGRQHGRIQLAPAEYVLVTDDKALLDEIRSLKTVEPLLRKPLTERAMLLSAADAPELLKRLRARGYAPMDSSETGEVPELPEDPAVVPELAPGPAPTRRNPAELDWSGIGSDEAPVDADGQVMEPGELRALMQDAVTDGLEVEMEYLGRRHEVPTVRTICPYYVAGDIVEAYCRLRNDDRYFNISRIAWARLTGEKFDLERV